MSSTYITAYELEKAFVVTNDAQLKRYIQAAVSKCHAIKVLGLVIEDSLVVKRIKELAK